MPLQTSDTEVSFELDTGEECNIILRKVYDRFQQKPKLHEAKAKLTSYNGGSAEVQEKCIVIITRPDKPGKSYPVQCFVVPNESPPILGLETCKQLNLIRTVMGVMPTTPDFMLKDDDAFCEIGLLSREHNIKLYPSVPAVVNPPRRIPFLPKDKVKNELLRMLRQGIISKVEEHTEWVNSIVIGKNKMTLFVNVWIPNNQAIKREHFPLQTADEIVADMAGAQYFSKLDASSGYWQIKLDEPSSKLLTFQTLFRRYKFHHLAFGVKSVSEVFQRKVGEIIEGLEGCKNNQDDIIIWIRSKVEHDKRLKAVLDRIQAAYLKLNREKCVFGVQQATFSGHSFTENGIKPDDFKMKAILEIPHPRSKQDLCRFMGMGNFYLIYQPSPHH